MSDVELERESTRFVAIRASRNGIAASAAQYAIVDFGIRPNAIPDSAWHDVVTQGFDVGFIHLPELVGGYYAVYARWQDGPDAPVERAGSLTVR